MNHGCYLCPQSSDDMACVDEEAQWVSMSLERHSGLVRIEVR